jgi:hypothetical protein
VALALTLVGCQTPESVRTLSRSSSALITETRAAAPAVQQYIAKQDRLVESRIARWNERKQHAETASVPLEALWAIDQEADGKKGDVKKRADLLALVRRNGSEVPPLIAPKPVPPAASDPASITKMTGLLEALASGKSEAAGFYLSYWQALSASLDKLNQDAAGAGANPAGAPPGP